MDAESTLRQRLENAFITASWFEEFRRRIGIVGLSQIWDEKPAWYFWLAPDHGSGAYELRLEAATDSPQTSGWFSIRYYPPPGTAAKLGFSRAERQLLESMRFDSTGTPRSEHRPHLPAELFQVGVLEMHCGNAEEETTLTVESFHRLPRAGAAAADALPARETRETLHPDTSGRGVPGWDLSHRLFERLVSLLTHHLRRPPARLRLTEERGFEPQAPAAGGRTHPSAAPTLRSLTVAFHSVPVEYEQLSSGETVLFDHGATTPGLTPPPPELPWLNPDWWVFCKTRFVSTAASTCGCGSTTHTATSGGAASPTASGSQ